MGHNRDRGNKEKRRPAKNDKKQKGLPPHLQRQREQKGPAREIQRHLDDLAQRPQ